MFKKLSPVTFIRETRTPRNVWKHFGNLSHVISLEHLQQKLPRTKSMFIFGFTFKRDFNLRGIIVKRLFISFLTCPKVNSTFKYSPMLHLNPSASVPLVLIFSPCLFCLLVAALIASHCQMSQPVVPPVIN